MKLSDAVSDKKETQMYMPTISTDESTVKGFYIAMNGPNAETDIPFYISNNIYRLLDLGVTEKNDDALQVLINDKFLSTLVNITRKEELDFSSDIYRQKMNRICYDYTKIDDKNIFIQNLLLTVVQNINKSHVQVLMGFNLTKDQACLLVAARYSTSSDISVNYKRLARVIQTMPTELMTEQKIVDIFGKLCSERVRDLFTSIMLDKFTSFRSSEEEYMYSTLNLALLDVVESMPMESIYLVLKSYMDTQKNSTKTPRFQLKSTNVGDYPRINATIDTLESQGIYVY